MFKIMIVGEASVRLQAEFGVVDLHYDGMPDDYDEYSHQFLELAEAVGAFKFKKTI